MEAKKHLKSGRLFLAGILVVATVCGIYYMYRQDSTGSKQAAGRSERQLALSTEKTKLTGENNVGSQFGQDKLSWTANGYNFTRHETGVPFKYHGAMTIVDSMSVISSICCYEENPVIGDSSDTRYIDYNKIIKKPYKAAKWAEFVVVAWHYANESAYPIPDINHELVMLYDAAEEKMLDEKTAPTRAYGQKLNLHFGTVADKLDPESAFHTVSVFEVAKKNVDRSNLSMAFIEDKEVSIVRLSPP